MAPFSLGPGLQGTGPAARALHLVGLCGFAFSQPLFELLRRHPTFLVAHGVDRADALLLAGGLALCLPAAFAGLALALQRLAPGAAGGIQAGAMGTLAAAFVLPGLGRLGIGPAPLSLSLAALLGAAAALAYARRRRVRAFATALAASALLFPALFLASAPVSRAVARAPAPLPALALERPAPLVVVVFDALALYALLDEDERIDARRAPHFAALAAESHWFRNATTVAEKTSAALPALLTGLYPVEDRPPSAAEYPANLFTWLAGSHALHVLEPVTGLCPATLCAPEPRAARLASLASDLGLVYLHWLLPPGVAAPLPAVDRTWRDFAAGRSGAGDAESASAALSTRGVMDVRWLFARFLEGIRSAPRRALHFVHLRLPHWPYRYLPSGLEYRPPGAMGLQYGDPDRWADPGFTEAAALQPYLLQVGYADALLGQLRQQLVDDGLWDEALVAITSDHGVSFDPRATPRLVTRDNLGDIVPVPLFVKLPGQREGVQSERNAETIDLLPTLVDALGGLLPAPVDGHSLLDEGSPERRHKRVFVHRSELLRIDLPPALPERSAAARRIAGYFDLSRAPDSLYALGRHRDLLGRDVATLAPAQAATVPVRLEYAEAFERVDPDSGFVPARVAGSFPAPAADGDGVEVAVALGGVVRGVTRSFDAGSGVRRFEALVPDGAFRPGRNAVAIYLVEGPPEAPRLVPGDTGAPASWTAISDAQGRLALLVYAGERLIPVLPGAVPGQVTRGDVYFRADLTAEAVLVFAAGRFLTESPPSASPGDPGRSLRRFRIPIPYGQLPDLSSRHLRFVGLRGEVASELGYGEGPAGPWPGPRRELQLTTRHGRRGLASAAGDWIPLPDGMPEGGQLGRLERTPGGDRALLRGAAPRAGGQRAPDAVALFADGRFLGTLGLGPACETGAPGSCPFQAELPQAGLEGELAGVALAGGRILSELAPAPWAQPVKAIPREDDR